MNNKYDIEVTALRNHCEALLLEMEEICNEIDKVIHFSDTRVCNMVCDYSGVNFSD